MVLLIIQIAVLSFLLFFFFVVLRQLLFFGFSPFLPSDPGTIENILRQTVIREGYTVFSLGYGRSGFLWAVEKKYPGVKLIGIEDSLLHSLTARLQAFLRRSRIKVIRSDYYQSDLSRADIIYCHLDVKILRDLYKKLRVEPRSGAVIISAGFIIPYLDCAKTLKAEPRKRWFSFLVGSHEKVLTEKEKEYKPDDKIYFYEV